MSNINITVTTTTAAWNPFSIHPIDDVNIDVRLQGRRTPKTINIM